MEKEIRSSVKYASTAAEVWSDLKERFGKESAPRAYESLSVTHQNGSSVSAYFTKLRSIWDEMQSVFPAPHCECNGCTCNVGKKLIEIKEKERLYEFLMGLDNDFSVIRIQILAMKPTPTLGNAYHLVSEDERQRIISSEKKPPTEAVAFKAFVPGRQENYSNQRRNKPTVKDVKQKDTAEYCTFCERDGHTRDGCFKLIGYPE